MIVLTIRSDKPEAEIGLFDLPAGRQAAKKIAYQKWHAHRELSSTLHRQIESLLKKTGKTWQDISGIVVFKGPGSFTGLRIGSSVANALAAGLNIPVAGEAGEDWAAKGLAKIQKSHNDKIVLLDYGAPAKITKPRG